MMMEEKAHNFKYTTSPQKKLCVLTSWQISLCLLTYSGPIVSIDR